MGGGEIESVHLCLLRSLQKLQKLFGGALAARYKEATMYQELNNTPLNVNELYVALIGG